MSIWLAILETISELFLFFIIIFLLLISGLKLPQNYIKRIILITIIICSFSLIFHTTYNELPKTIQFAFLILNYFKFTLCACLFYNIYSAKAVLVTLIIQSFCELLTSFLFLILPLPSTQATNISIFSVLTCRLLLLIIFYITWKKSIKALVLSVPSYVLTLVLVNIFLSSMLIRVVELEWDNNQLQTLLIKILAFANTLCLIVVLVSLLTNVLFRQYQKDINKILENQVQIQLKHYEKSEKINTEIRRFRHDYNNHMNCMKSLVQSGRYDELMDYINHISNAFPQSGFLYNTGNYIADAILTDKLENARKNGTNISFKGIISPSINNTDLCIILGNILDNAVEACEKIDGEKEISVFGGYQHGYFILIAKNPISCHVQTENGIPATTKPDTAYHGFGLQNVESVVKKYDGIMLPECSGDSFTIRLTFNSIQETATV